MYREEANSYLARNNVGRHDVTQLVVLHRHIQVVRGLSSTFVSQTRRWKWLSYSRLTSMFDITNEVVAGVMDVKVSQ